MKLLYVSSCHPTLEYNDLSLFTSMGINCFSTGVYFDPSRPLDNFSGWRSSGVPGMKKNEDMMREFSKINPTYHSSLRGYERPPLRLTKEFVSKFDVVICNSFFHYLERNWNEIKDSLVIWRTYGDQTKEQEIKAGKDFPGLLRIRVLDNEKLIGNAIEGHVIHCSVDEDWFCGWKGSKREILSFQNAFASRQHEAAGQAYLKLRSLMFQERFSLYGDYFNLHPLVKGQLTTEQQLQEYQECMVYFSIGSHPAPVTFNFVEAWMVGIPVVTFGYQIGAAPKRGIKHLYQVPEFIENGVDGFYSDSLGELEDYISHLLDNEEDRKSLSQEGQKKARSLWGKESVSNQWRNFFLGLGLSV